MEIKEFEKKDLLGQPLVIEKDGKEVECEIILTFDCEQTKKCYIAYTDHSIDSNGRTNIFVSSYDPIFGLDKLEDVSIDELKMVQDVLVNIDNM